MSAMRTLKPIEQEAMRLLHRHTALLLSVVPETTETDHLGTRTPGQATYARLEKWGLCFLTEEDLMFPDQPEMGTWMPSYQLTEEGEAWWAACGNTL